MTDIALQACGLSKSFDGIEALFNVDLPFAKGKMHALVGENGAAKTTLFRILAGELKQTSGSVGCGRQVLRGGDLRGASKAGIGLLPQRGSLCPSLTITENFALAASASFYLDRSRLQEMVGQELRAIGASCDADALASKLSTPDAKFVELARLLWSGKKIILLDEPTSIIGTTRAGFLFEKLRELVSQGKTIVFSSHRVGEVMEWADEIHVLRKGKLVLSAPCDMVDRKGLLASMFGTRLTQRDHMEAVPSGTAALKAKSLVCKGQEGKPFDIDVKSGECVAVVGLPGNGQDEIVATLTGLENPVKGSFFVRGKEKSKDASMRLWGLARMPEDAVGMSAMEAMRTDENLILHDSGDERFQGKHGLLDWNAIGSHAMDCIAQRRLSIPDPQCEFGWLSGGNQRKLLLARELEGRPCAFVACNAEAGLDYVSCMELATSLEKIKSEGAGLLLFMEELDFLARIVDRAFLIEGGILKKIKQEKLERQMLG